MKGEGGLDVGTLFDVIEIGGMGKRGQGFLGKMDG